MAERERRSVSRDDAADPQRPAFYALAPGGWRDYWTLLHPPYTLWHLSYVAIGAAVAARIDVRWLLETLAAFFLAVGLAAHALDELHGRPLRTRIPSPVLWAIAGVAVAGALAFGADGVIEDSAWIALFMVVGAFLVVAYNLEVFGGLFHSDVWFAIAWGAFPAITSSFAQLGRTTTAAVLVAVACAFVSGAQRILSTPVRQLRRHATSVRGELALDDGTRVPLDADALRSAPERALRVLSIAMPVLAVGLVLSRRL
jgi:hypothetical protein